MKPININISVQVGLTEDTGRTLRELFLRDKGSAAPQAVGGTEKAANGTGKAEKRTGTTGKRTETTETGTEKAPEPAAAPKPESAPAVTDSVLREAVKRAKDSTDVKTVRALFTEFGIGASSECPEDRRPELLRRLGLLERGGQDNA